MLIGGIALGLILGLLVGGSITNLATVRLHRLPLLFVAVIVRFGTEFLLNAHVPLAEALRVPLLGTSFALLLVALWANRGYPGMSLAFIGVLANGVVILVNGGYMPIYLPSLLLAGLHPADVTTSLHTIMPPALDASFLLHLGPFADVIPIPFPIIQNVASIGDVFLTLGLAFFLFAAVVRVPQELDEAELAAIRTRLDELAASGRPLRAGDPGAETGLSPALTGAVALQRPLVLGSAGTGMASPSLSTFEADAVTPGSVTVTIPLPVDRDGRTRPAAPIRPAGAQRLVLGAVGGPAHLAVRRPAQSDRARDGRGDHDRLRARDRARVLRRDAAEPAPQPDRRRVRRPMGPQGGHGRQRPPPRGDRAAPARRRGDQHPAGLPADLPGHDDLGLLPAGPGRDPPADRPGGGPPERELRDVGRRDDRRCRRLPARRRVRRAPRLGGPAGVLVRQRDIPRVGGAARHDRGQRGPRPCGCGRGPSQPRCRDDRGLAVPAARDGPAGQHPAGRGRPVQPRHLHRPDAVVRPGHLQRVGLRLAGRVRLPRDRDRARQPHRRVRHRTHRRRASRRAGWSSRATWRWAS